MRRSDFLAPVTSTFVSSLDAYCFDNSCFALRAEFVGLHGARTFEQCSVQPAFPQRREDLPGSWEALSYMPRSSTPAGWVCQAIAALHRRLPLLVQCRHPRFILFRGSITRPARSLFTLHAYGYPQPRKTRFWLAASLGQAGISPAVLQMRFRFTILLSQAFPGAHQSKTGHFCTSRERAINEEGGARMRWESPIYRAWARAPRPKI
jgi:hypothetical protein